MASSGSAAMKLNNAGELHSLKGASKHSPEELKKQFTQFVGQTFYGQMMKSMRSTVEKPAYFHGGRGEEVFQGQLDQTMADAMTKSTATRFADPMFHRQFPNMDTGTPKPQPATVDLSQLEQLSRR
jgi:Rod binding domain-containing protein